MMGDFPCGLELTMIGENRQLVSLRNELFSLRNNRLNMSPKSMLMCP